MPPSSGPLTVLCGELRGDSSDEGMGCYSPRSMNAAKLLLSASRANIGNNGIRKSGGSAGTPSRAIGRSKSLDGSVPFKLTPPTVASNAPYPSVAAAAAAAVQEAMATVLATRQCFTAAPVAPPKRRASGAKSSGVAAHRARSQSCPELQQDALELLASLKQQPPLPQHRTPLPPQPPQQPQQPPPPRQAVTPPPAAPAFGFRFGQASTGALAPEKALLPALPAVALATVVEPPPAAAVDGLAALALTASQRSEESDDEERVKAEALAAEPVPMSD